MGWGDHSSRFCMDSLNRAQSLSKLPKIIPAKARSKKEVQKEVQDLEAPLMLLGLTREFSPGGFRSDPAHFDLNRGFGNFGR